MAVLRVEGLRKQYGSLVAVDGATFEVRQGSCFGLLGPNGAGKTTTILMIVGVMDPDKGTVTLDGEKVGPETFSVKSRIDYVTQELALYEELSATDNLKIFGALYGLSGTHLQERVAAALAIVNLQDRATERVNKFSGGMKRRLNVALALLHDPELIVLDEPTVGVDPQSRNAIFDTLRSLQKQGKTLLYTTHYMEEVEKLCDTIAVMDHGRVIAQGTLRELQQHGMSASVVSLEAPGVPVAALQELEANAELHSLHYEDPVLTVGVKNFADGLSTVLGVLRKHGTEVTSVASSKPSLESLFLELTGRSLRD